MFDEFAVWDIHKKYRPHTITIGYQSSNNAEIIIVKSGQQLKEVLSNHNFMLTSSIPTFILTSGELNIN